MQFVLILAVLGALALGERADGPVDAPWLRAAVSLAAMLLAPLLSWVLTRHTVADLARADGGADRRRALRSFGRGKALLTVLLLAAAAGVLSPLGWARLVRFSLPLGPVPLAEEALLLLPLLGPLLLCWAAYYDVDRWLRMAADGGHSGAAAVSAVPNADSVPEAPTPPGGLLPARTTVSRSNADGALLTQPWHPEPLAERPTLTQGDLHSPRLTQPWHPEPQAKNPVGDRVWSRGEYVAFQARTHLLLVLAPLVPLVLTQDILLLAAPTVAEGDSAWLAMLPALAAVLFGFPWLLRRVWKAHPLPAGPLRERLEQSAHRWGLRVRDILVWDTERMVANAAVAGFVPGWRYVFLSDALLEHFTAAEMEAVFGHEVGHIRHRHLLLRALVLLAPLSLLPLAQFFWPAGEELPAAGSAWFGPSSLAGLGVVLAAGAYVGAVFGYCSRWFERQADLFGCRIASAVAADGELGGALTHEGIRTFISALEKLSTLNGIRREARSWQHDSIARRVAFLEQVALDPRHETGCHRQVRLLGGLVLGVIVAGLVLPIVAG